MQPKRSSAPFDAASFDGHASGAAHWWKESFQLKLPLMVSVMGTASFQTQFPVFQFLYHLCHKLSLITSSTRTRRGGSCLKDIYETFLIYRTCMRRAPAKPVRACTLRKLMSCFTCHTWSSTSHFTLHTPHCTLHTALFTLHSSHFTLHTLHTSHCTLRSQHFTLHTPHFTLHTSHSTLHTALFTPHTSHCTLHTPHFISSELFSALLHVSKVEGNSCWCIASNRNGKCEHGVVVTCQGDSRSPSWSNAICKHRFQNTL